MPDFPKAAELFQIFSDEVVTRSKKLTVNAVDRDGSDANIMGYGAAVVGEEVIGQLASVEDQFWLDSSRGQKLDKWAYDRYSLTRKPASNAFATLAFSCAVPAPAGFSIPAGTVVSSSDGVQFQTVVTVAFPLGGTGPVSAMARSTVAGGDQDVQSGTLTNLVSQLTGSPTDLVVTNPQAAAGAADVEDDDAFKARIRQFWNSVRRGTKGAIETGVLAVPGVVSAAAFEGLQSYGYPSRMMTLVIADAFTDALVLQGADVPTYDTQGQAFAAAVFTALGDYRCYGMPVNIVVAQVVILSVALRLRFQASVQNTDALALYARTLVAEYVNELVPGAQFDPAAVTALLASVPGLDIDGDEVASPVGPVIPTSPYQVLRSSLANVTTDSQATQQSQAAFAAGL